MADIADVSNEDADYLKDLEIGRIRAQAAKQGPGLVPRGRCYWCQEPLPAGEVFCQPFDETDPGCKSDYESNRRQKTMRKV